MTLKFFSSRLLMSKSASDFCMMYTITSAVVCCVCLKPFELVVTKDKWLQYTNILQLDHERSTQKSCVLFVWLLMDDVL